MAEKPKSGSFSTVYEAEDAGMLTLDRRKDIEAEVASYVAVIGQLREDFKQEPEVVEGLREIEKQLGALRISKEPEEEVRKKLAALVHVPLAEGKELRLDAFRRKAAKSTLADPAEYVARVKQLVRNTEGNLTQLLLTWPEDSILQKFHQDIENLNLEGTQPEVKIQMEALAKSPQLWHYNQKKKDFLLEWLRPFQEYFGKPVEELTEEDIQAAVQKVEKLRETALEEMTNMVPEPERSPFRVHNRRMHPIMNGKNRDFWGSNEVRDEFIALLNKLLTRFSLTLEDRFLLFKSKDGGFCYLAGLADDAFDEATELKDGRLGIYPHLKVFLKMGDGHYAEIQKESYGKNSAAYFRALKTAVVPFLTSIAVMLEHTLSKELREAFDMWA